MWSRRNMLRAGLFVGTIGSGLGVAGVAGVYRFELTRHTSPLRGLTKPIRVLQLSDLHYGPYIHAASVGAWVDTAMQQQADLILITGDILDTSSHEGSRLGRVKQAMSKAENLLYLQLQKLRAPLGVYAVWGNHDYSTPENLKRLEANLNQIGIKVLINQGKLLRPDFFLAGVDDLWYGKPDVGQAIQNLEGSAACLLMCHNPDYLYKVPSRVDLTLCGHTHGGQLRLPLLGSPWAPSQYGSKFLSGWIQDPQPAFVSRGLGVTGLPLRNVGAEMTLFNFQPKEV